MSTNRVCSAVFGALVLLSGVVASVPASASDNYVIESCGYCNSDAQFTEAAVNTGISGLVYMVNTNSHVIQAYAVVNEVEPGVYIRSATRVAGDAEVKQMLLDVLTIFDDLNKQYASGDLGLTHESAVDITGIPDELYYVERQVISYVSENFFRQLRNVATDALNNNSWADLFSDIERQGTVWVEFPDGSRVKLELTKISVDHSGTDHEFEYEIAYMVDSENRRVPTSRDGFNHMTRTGPNGYVDRYRRAAERFGWETVAAVCDGNCLASQPSRLSCQPATNTCTMELIDEG